MKNRLDIAKYLAELGFTKGAEIGVCDGYYSKILLDTIPDLELLCIDSWIHNRKKEYAIAVKKLSTYVGAKIIKKSSVDAAKEVKDDYLDFVFIDAAHDYENVKTDINTWFKKIRPGGILYGHDYHVFHHSKNTGVIDAVDEFAGNNNVKLNIIDWDWSLNRNDRTPCWWFFK